MKWKKIPISTIAIVSFIAAITILVTVSRASPDKKPVEKPTYRVTEVVLSNEVSMSLCAPCHIDLETRRNNPKLIFQHTIHFRRGIRCNSCHTERPHTRDQLIKRPKMEACVNCHMIKHSKQGKWAPETCRTCHPADFKLTPDDHTPAFLSQGHARIKKRGACLVCHRDRSFCETCHGERNIKPGSDTDYRLVGLWPRPELPIVTVAYGTKNAVKAPNCVPCHASLEQSWPRNNKKLIRYNHAAHFRKLGAKCDRCHPRYPHSPDKLERPRMRSCFNCHGVQHSKQGKRAPSECTFCHPSDMKLKPEYHTSDWVRNKHTSLAKEDRGECLMCHDEKTFCTACHSLEPLPHKRGWRDLHGAQVVKQAKVGSLACPNCHLMYFNQDSDVFKNVRLMPNLGGRLLKPSLYNDPQTSLKPSRSFCSKCHKGVDFPHPDKWANIHGKVAKFNRPACLTCHSWERFCFRCHQLEYIPHPDNWLGMHRLYLQQNSRDVCLRCHIPQQCDQCHTIHGLHRQNNLYRLEGDID